MAMMYRVKVVRGDLQIEADGDKRFVLDMLARFDKPPTAPLPVARSPKGRAGTAPPTPLGKTTSPGEFIRQFHFKRHTDFVLAFGYYLEHHSDLKEFAAGDINNCYYEAKLESSNTSQMIIQNIKRGYMMEAKRSRKSQKGGRKLFTLTRSGEDYLQKAVASRPQE